MYEVSEVILYVEKMQEAVEFYRDRIELDLLYPKCKDFSNEMWVVFSTGACKLCLHGGVSRKERTGGAKVVFGVDQIQKARERLTSRGVELSEVRVPAEGVYVCDGKDPDGNPFSIEEMSR